MIDVTGIDELMKQLNTLSNQQSVETICKIAVNKAVTVSESAVKSSLASAEQAWDSDTNIAGSVASTPAKVNSYGVFSVSRPTGYHIGKSKKHISNAALAAFLQYGSGGTGKREPHPWREKAVSASENKCFEIMEETLKQEMKLD